jgi:hypothetical protein
MKRNVTVFALAGILLFTAAAFAHHSIGAAYDLSKDSRIEGKLVQFNFRNPHSFVTIDATDAAGKVQRWVVEWGGAGALGGQGITRNTLKVGDEVIITGNPSRTAGLSRLKMNTLHRKSDGFGWGTRPGEVVD